MYWFIGIGGNLEIFICNISAKESTDIELYLDGKKIMEENFNDNPYLSCKSLSLKVFPGKHKLIAKTSDGSIQKEFSFISSLVTRIRIELTSEYPNLKDSNNFDFVFLPEWIIKKNIIE